MKKRIIEKHKYRGGFSDEVPHDEQERLKKRLETVEVEKIKYKSLDGLEVEGFIVRPKNMSGKLPCIIFNRGGNNGFGAINTSMLADWWARMANWGYVVIGANYRGSHAQGKDEFGGADLQDVLALKDVLGEIDGADEERIGMYGMSRGGMMTYLAMREVEWIDAAVTVGAPVDLQAGLKDRPEMRKVYEHAFGSTEKGVRERSVVHWVDELSTSTSLLILQGAEDNRTNPEQVKRFVDTLADTNVDYCFELFECAGHALGEMRGKGFEVVEEWFGKYV